MDFLAIGGDRRYAWMAALAREQGMTAAALGQERSGVEGMIRAGMEDIPGARVLVMPCPRGGKVAAPMGEKGGEQYIYIEEIFSLAGEKALVACFGPGDREEMAGKGNEVFFMDEDEGLLRTLARQTAEGAIASLQQRSERELYGQRALVIGYGRIGQAISGMLMGYGVQVLAAARRRESRRQALEKGCFPITLEEMEKELPGIDLVICTVPNRVVDEKLAGMIPRQALALDLSSPPYGLDVQAWGKRGLNVWREPGLPGRYCPRSAGEVMVKCLKRHLEGGEKDAE